MKTMVSHEDEKLKSLLAGARPAPALPPRFQENVWRRIERAEAGRIPATANWLEALATRLLRPRLAFAIATVLVLAGLGLGWSQGEQTARHEAQARYLAAVAPDSLR